MIAFEQKPIEPNEWLYEDESENVRNFWKVMSIPNGGEKLKECTNEEKEQWEAEHKQENEVD